ncbi:hypothetical protein SAMN04488516_1021, partial [Desulfonauticus submarinus]
QIGFQENLGINRVRPKKIANNLMANFDLTSIGNRPNCNSRLEDAEPMEQADRNPRKLVNELG